MPASGEAAPARVAVLGAGGFVRDAWVPALKEAAAGGALVVAAVWSRSSESCWSVLPELQAISPGCAPFHGDGGLQALMGSPEIDAVLVVLPRQAQGAVIQAALRAGKHVLSEKPAAPTLQQAEQLLAFHASLPQPAPLWLVAENYRSIPAFLRLRQAIAAGELGTIVRLDMSADLALAPGNKYYESAWRRDSATMPGAYLTEGGVHFVAALRLAAEAAGFGQAVAAAAASRGVSDDLPHPDCLQGLLWFESGASASVSITTAAGAASIALRAVGTAGTAEAARGGLGSAGSRTFRLVQQGASDAAPTQFESSSPGLHDELLSFVRLVHAAGHAGPGGAARPAAPAGAVAAAAGGTAAGSLTLTPAEARSAAASDGSDPEADAAGGRAAAGAAVPGVAWPGGPSEEGISGGGKGAAAAPAALGSPAVRDEGRGSGDAIEGLPSEEDAYRISAGEAVRDLAVVAALLQSAEQGGIKVAVRQF
ncbi:hypothetical protein ABPG75_011576 [Micractinium tetrahymenae]